MQSLTKAALLMLLVGWHMHSTELYDVSPSLLFDYFLPPPFFFKCLWVFIILATSCLCFFFFTAVGHLLFG